jgi:hypothetical protein
MFYLIIIRFIPFFYKKEILDQSHKLSFSPLKFLGLEKFPFFSFFFLSFSLFFLSSSILPHATSLHEQQELTKQNRDRASSPSSTPRCPSLRCSSPQPAATSPLPLLLPPPLSPLWQAPMVGHESQSPVKATLPWRAPTKVIFSRDNQNGCARPSSCYPRPQFYPKQTLISGYLRISFFNKNQILSLPQILILLDSSHTPI